MEGGPDLVSLATKYEFLLGTDGTFEGIPAKEFGMRRAKAVQDIPRNSSTALQYSTPAQYNTGDDDRSTRRIGSSFTVPGQP